jgi:hypothetical protein
MALRADVSTNGRSGLQRDWAANCLAMVVEVDDVGHGLLRLILLRRIVGPPFPERGGWRELGSALDADSTIERRVRNWIENDSWNR